MVVTGETHMAKVFLDAAFPRAGLDLKKHVAFDRQYPSSEQGGPMNRRCQQGQEEIGLGTEVKVQTDG